MKKTLSAALGAAAIALGASLSTPALASVELPIDQHTFQLGSIINYDLPSHTPQVFSNIFQWAVSANCTIIETDEAHDITFKVLRKKAAVNDVQLSRGESVTATVHPDEEFHLSVNAGATVELTNESNEPVTTRCVAATL